jgi:outer membrane protein assembly factor BamB
MDDWSHPRHAANGNAVSGDSLAGPPDRVRWVAAATREVEGMVSAKGRNFYGGILARDSFNGLRLWHLDPNNTRATPPVFTLSGLAKEKARPIAVGNMVIATVEGNLSALEAASGVEVDRFKGTKDPREVLCEGGMVVAADATGVRAYGGLNWERPATGARNLIAGNGIVSFIESTDGETAAVALDLRYGMPKWRRNDLPWLNKVVRTVSWKGLIAYEESSLNDHDAGNALHILDANSGKLLWEKAFPPGMNHNRQARAMFLGEDLWILHGGRVNTKDPRKQKRLPIQVSALDPYTGETRVTHPAGLAHCFPPVATANYILAGVMDLTDLKTGELIINPVTKANCSREGGWVPANGLIYTTPKHCTCWPMLRGYTALAPKRPGDDSTSRPNPDEIAFVLERGEAKPVETQASPADWPTYRHDRWRSGSTQAPGPEELEILWSAALEPEAEWPDGPILHDWREDPFVKSPVSAPTIAGDMAFVARGHAREVIAIDTATGSVRWRHGARGRVDTPPTIHRGLCLFGSHAGDVTALRADTGELVWRLQVAPNDERIVAYGQIESAWPVSGTVLVMNDTLYFSAGRQPFADGGILVFAVDPMTGGKRWVNRIDDIPQKGYYENSGLEFDPVDILHQEGDGFAMSRWLISADGKDVSVDKWNAFAHLDTGGGAAWVPRGAWTYGPRHQHRFRGEAPRRPLCVYRDKTVLSSLNGSTEIFRRDFESEEEQKFSPKWITGWEAGSTANKGGNPYRTYRLAQLARWTTDPYTPQEERKKRLAPGVQRHNEIHAMTLTGDGRLFTIHKDGRLKVISTNDGKVVAEETLPTPAWDGLAVAQRKLFLTTQDGRLLCVGAKPVAP